MERLICFPIFYNNAFRAMIQQTIINTTINSNSSQDPTEWLKNVITATKLLSPVDCNNLKNPLNIVNLGYSTYSLDALNASDAQAAWQIFPDQTAFYQF